MNNRDEIEKLARLDREMMVLRAERHQARVSTLITEGKLLPSREDWALSATPEALDAYLEAIGGEVIASKWPTAEESVKGKGIITVQDRALAKHTGLTEEQMQEAADIRFRKFGT